MTDTVPQESETMKLRALFGCEATVWRGCVNGIGYAAGERRAGDVDEEGDAEGDEDGESRKSFAGSGG